MFKRHVMVETDEASNLHFGTASCLHCPMFFRFETSPAVIDRLITRHELEAVTVMPDFMRQSVQLLHEPWWINDPILGRSKKYWVMLEGLRGGEPRMRMALVDGSTVYFATSGYFQLNDYRKLPLAMQKHQLANKWVDND